MAQDWLFRHEDGVSDFRCAGLLIRDGRVLLQRAGQVYAMPGGHVMHGETGAEAVEREFMEELGVRVCCGQMLWSEESFWEWQGKMHHTLSFYYPVEMQQPQELSGEGPWTMKDDPDVQMMWVPMDELDALTVYPTFLKQQIKELRPGHFVSREI